MAVRRNGITDEFIIETSGGTDITDELGNIQTVSWTINTQQEKRGSVGSQPDFVEIIDGVKSVDLDLTVDLPNLQVLKLMGEEDVDGNITFTDALPEFTVKIPTDDGKHLEIRKVKWGNATLTAEDEEITSIDFTGIGLEVEEIDSSISTPDKSTGQTVNFMELKFSIEGTDVDALDSLDFTIDRDIQPVRGIKPSSSETQRPFYDEIIEGMKDFTFTTSFQVTDDTATEYVFDDSTNPKQFSGSQRANIPTMTLHTDSSELILEDSRFEDAEMTQEADTEVRTIDGTGDSLNAKVEVKP